LGTWISFSCLGGSSCREEFCSSSSSCREFDGTVRERERERIIIREGGSDQFFWPLKRGDAQNGGLAEGYGGGGIFTVLVAVLQSAKKSTHSNICSSFSDGHVIYQWGH
jgi:hypothetical protein